LEECGRSNLFFRDTVDASKRRSICIKLKLLMSLKCLAFGVSPSCFQDYFQMGELSVFFVSKTFVVFFVKMVILEKYIYVR
jgi:flagellar biosynthesis protein FliQ